MRNRRGNCKGYPVPNTQTRLRIHTTLVQCVGPLTAASPSGLDWSPKSVTNTTNFCFPFGWRCLTSVTHITSIRGPLETPDTTTSDRGWEPNEETKAVATGVPQAESAQQGPEGSCWL